jgi:hypothetical protein
MKILSLILVLCLFSASAFGTTVTTNDGTNCDFSKIVKNADGTYQYSAQLNLCVGKIVQDNQTQVVQIADLHKSIDLYKVTIKTDEERIQAWIQTSVNLENHVSSINDLDKKNEWLYFGLGVLATGVAAYTASRLTSH